MVNENPMDKLIRELKEENEKLKKSLQGGGVPEVGGGALSAEGASICLQAFWTPSIKNDWLNMSTSKHATSFPGSTWDSYFCPTNY